MKLEDQIETKELSSDERIKSLEKADLLEVESTESVDTPKQILKGRIEESEENEVKLRVPMIVHREHAPDWLIDNKYILHGYRVDFQRKRDLIKSLFMKHNELLNIWTHLIGGIIFIVFVFYMIFYFDLLSTVYNKIKDFLNTANIEVIKKSGPELMNKIESAAKNIKLNSFIESNIGIIRKGIDYLKSHSDHVTTTLDKKSQQLIASCIYSIAKLKETLHLENDSNLEKVLSTFGLEKMISNLQIWPILFFLATAVFCLGCSTIFHWFHPKNSKLCKILNRIDLAGISILIYGSSVSVLYYISYCKMTFFWIYFGLFTVGSTSVFSISMMDWYYENKNKTLRTYIYMVLGLVSGLSLLHAIINRIAYSEPTEMPILKTCIIMGISGATYIVGAHFYILKIPERWKPGFFDIWLNSHTIWHFFVFFAALLHFFAVIEAYTARALYVCKV